MSAYSDAHRRLDDGLAHIRAWLSRRVPKVLTLYPFEILVGVIGLIVGLPLLLGLASPASLVLILPDLGYWAYTLAISLGGATTLAGLRMRNALVLASGLQLTGGSFAIYGLAVVALSGFATAWLAFAAYSLLGLLAAIRALHFRRLVDIQKGASTIRDKDHP